MTLGDLEWLSKVSNDIARGTFLQQLSFLFRSSVNQDIYAANPTVLPLGRNIISSTNKNNRQQKSMPRFCCTEYTAGALAGHRVERYLDTVRVVV